MQGFNMGRYYAPSTEHAPTFNHTHPLGARARKAGDGILTVRFEMPFAIWCGGCPKPTIIGQGVRFNAEKRRVGAYHSTPIWAFRMRHAACGGAIEIHTDPAAAEYVVAEGATRRDYGDARREEQRGLLGEIVTEEERERRRNDAFAAFEGKKSDKEKAKAETDRVDELKRLRERDWDDPYMANKKLRQEFRAGRKIREGNAKVAEALQDKFSVGFDLVEEDEGDKLRAGAVEFGALGEDDSFSKVAGKPLFDSKSASSTSGTTRAAGKTKAEVQRDAKISSLQKDLRGNTRASMDPFAIKSSARDGSVPSKPTLPGVKRKQSSQENGAETQADTAAPVVSKPALVDYDSD